MGKRRLLKVQDRQRLFDIPTDDDGLIRHYSLSADRLEIGLRRREHNQLGFAVQLCLMRYPGRVLATDETPPRAMLKYGGAIASATGSMFRERGSLLPAIDTIERIGLAARAIARRRAERALIEEISVDTLQSLDKLLEVDPAIGQTRFHWLRSAPDAPGASDLVGLTERIAFLRKLEIDPKLQMRISSGR